MSASFVPLEQVSFTGCSVASDAEPLFPARRCSNPTPPSSNASRVHEGGAAKTSQAVPACPRGPHPSIARHQPPTHVHAGPVASSIDTSVLQQINESMTDLCDLLPNAEIAPRSVQRRRDGAAAAADQSHLSDVCAKIDFLADVVLRHERLLRTTLAPPSAQLSHPDRSSTASYASEPSSRRRRSAAPVHESTVEQPSVLMRSILDKVETVNSMIERIATPSAEKRLPVDASGISTSGDVPAATLARVADALEALSVQVARQSRAIEELEHTAYLEAHRSRVVEPADYFAGDRSAPAPTTATTERALLGQYFEDDGFIPSDERSPARYRSAPAATGGFIEPDERSPARQRDTSVLESLLHDTADGFIPSDERSPARSRYSNVSASVAAMLADVDASGLIPSDERSPARRRYTAAQPTRTEGILAANEQSPARTGRRRVVADVEPELAYDHIERPATATPPALNTPRHNQSGTSMLSGGEAQRTGRAVFAGLHASALKPTAVKVLPTVDADVPKPLYYATPVSTAKKQPTSRPLFDQHPAHTHERFDTASQSSAFSTAPSATTRTTMDVENELEERLRLENASLKAQLHQQMSLNERLILSAGRTAVRRPLY